jgi:hypothetical protein
MDRTIEKGDSMGPENRKYTAKLAQVIYDWGLSSRCLKRTARSWADTIEFISSNPTIMDEMKLPNDGPDQFRKRLIELFSDVMREQSLVDRHRSLLKLAATCVFWATTTEMHIEILTGKEHRTHV